MARTIYADTRKALADLNIKMRNLMDVAQIPDRAPLDRKIQGALNQLYAAYFELPGQARNASALRSPVLIFPVKGRDMRDWFTSDQRPSHSRAGSLLKRGSRRASRVASAGRVVPQPGAHPYRPITAKQYLRLLDEAIYSDDASPDDDEGGYRSSQVFAVYDGDRPGQLVG